MTDVGFDKSFKEIILLKSVELIEEINTDALVEMWQSFNILILS